MGGGCFEQPSSAIRRATCAASIGSTCSPIFSGGVLLMKQWGRIGTQGRVVAERYNDEAPALAALQRQAERKRRRGYVTSTCFL